MIKGPRLGFSFTGTATALFLAMITVAAALPGPAAADDGWNPFAKADERRARARAKARKDSASAVPQAQPLPPMNGTFGEQPRHNAVPYTPAPGFSSRGYNDGGTLPLPPLTGPGNAVESTSLAPIPGVPSGAAAPLPPGGMPSPTGTAGGYRDDLRFGRYERGAGDPTIAPGSPRRADLPADLWRGLNITSTEQLAGGISLPLTTPAMSGLWRRLWTTAAAPPDISAAGNYGPNHFLALRLEALYRAGMLYEMAELLKAQDASRDPIIAALSARALIGLGDANGGCRHIATATRQGSELPKHLKGDALLAMGYCAAIAGNAGTAGLAAELARNEGVKSPLAMAILDAVATGRKPVLEVPERMSLIDFRFLRLASSADPTSSLDTAEPALFTALALDASAKPEVRLAAGERAARINAIDGGRLAQIYKAQAFHDADVADPLPTKSAPPLRRALLFQAIAREREPDKRAQYILELFALADKDGLRQAAAEMLAPLTDGRGPARGGPGFAETAIEITAMAGDFDAARAWVRPSVETGNADPLRLAHWLALIDIGEVEARGTRGSDLRHVEGLARSGAFSPDQLHRLATVLDALEYNVPIPLWEAASRTPQPNGGHLPETGVLAQLKAAASRKEKAHVILLTLRTLGPKGVRGAHMIALGDAIRALKQAGLGADARRLGFEALIGDWPRVTRR